MEDPGGGSVLMGVSALHSPESVKRGPVAERVLGGQATTYYENSADSTPIGPSRQ